MSDSPQRAEAQVVADLARGAAKPNVLDVDTLYDVVDVDGSRHVLDTAQYGAQPRRKIGTITLATPQAFVAAVAKHSEAGTEIYSDVDSLRVTAVLNAPTDSEPGWGDHRAVLALRRTKAWQEWAGRDGRWLQQTEFAEFLEQRLIDVVTPDGADLLELAQTFKATKAVAFESSQRLSTGEVQLVYKEDVEAKAGKRGQIAIPDTFTLGLAPFDGARAYKVTARLRYRITDANLVLGFVLERPDDVIEAAFGDVLHEIGTGLDMPIWPGSR